MSLSVRTRFEVFKRDRFTCTYCGGHPPDVLLEVDHIIPRAAGGLDDLENLVTACLDCNRGKSDRLLEEGARPVDRAIVDDAQERLAQAQAYAESVVQLREVGYRLEWMVVEAWANAFGAVRKENKDGTAGYSFEDYGRFPNEASVRRILKRLPVSDVLEAVDITSSKFRSASSSAERYFFGVCWRMVDRREGTSP